MSAKLLRQLIILPFYAIYNSIEFQCNIQKTTILKRLYTLVLVGYKYLCIKHHKINSIIKISRKKIIIKATLPTTVNKKIILAAVF
ncbi:MAG: hypothetical protein QM495_03350 [Lutibacter sp.]|uniref:hypothetical protein n=1 Tax=Lutibacter sp. TaxID=1925666 RepID=UPI00385EFFE8